MLERDGVTVVGTARTGDEALPSAQATRPDVILIDVRLGNENGFDVARGLDDHVTMAEDWKPVIILISSYSEEELAGSIAANPTFTFLEKTALSGDRIKELATSRHDDDVTQCDRH